MKFKTYLRRMLSYIRHGQPVNYTTVVIKGTNPSERLKDRNILITGGGRGLGFYIAKKCIEEGANVIITGRSEETLKSSVEKLGDNCKYITCDVTNIESISKCIDKAGKFFDGKVDSLVSNAGISLHEGNFRNVSEEGWDTQLNTNLRGNYFMVKTFIEHLEKHDDPSGNIVVISSERAQRADDIPYGLTKVATNSFIQGFASKVIDENIRINGLAPGVTASDMTGFKRDENLYADWQNGNRIFLPEEVAEVALFLLSDVSDCISGEIINCDKGRYISTW